MNKCLDDDSRKCYNFIKENSLLKSKIKSKYLDKIFSKLEEIKIEQKCSKTKTEKVKLKNLEYSQFIAKEHLESIKKEDWRLIERNCKLNNFEWKVYQYMSDNNYKFNELSIKRIAYILGLHNFEEDINLTIYLYPTRFKKVITTDKVWKPLHINGGMSSSINSVRDVYVWRYEEMPKVVLHEMVHAMRIDEALFDYSLSNKFISDFGLLKSNYINVFESYTEIVANILNVMLFCIENNRTDYYELLNIERNWSLFQAARVLKISGYETIDEFLSNKDKLIQETNVFSYYILRSAHMYSLEDYLEWIENNAIIGFKLRDNASDSYYDLSMKAFDNVGYKEIINDYIIIYEKSDDKFIKETMRMTSIEGISKLDNSIELSKHFFLKKIK